MVVALICLVYFLDGVKWLWVLVIQMEFASICLDVDGMWMRCELDVDTPNKPSPLLLPSPPTAMTSSHTHTPPQAQIRTLTTIIVRRQNTARSDSAATGESGSEAGQLHEEKALLGGKKTYFFLRADVMDLLGRDRFLGHAATES